MSKRSPTLKNTLNIKSLIVILSLAISIGCQEIQSLLGVDFEDVNYIYNQGSNFDDQHVNGMYYAADGSIDHGAHPLLQRVSLTSQLSKKAAAAGGIATGMGKY